MKLQKKGMKFLRTFHILTASIWFGGVICIGVIVRICFFSLDESAFLIVAPLVPSLYSTVIMPVGLLIILQGIVYGCFTGWGFFKHRWITLKWVSLVLVMLCTGMGAIGQMFSAIEKVKAQGLNGGFADGGIVLLFIVLQSLYLAFMIAISVYKPALNKNKLIKTDS